MCVCVHLAHMPWHACRSQGTDCLWESVSWYWPWGANRSDMASGTYTLNHFRRLKLFFKRALKCILVLTDCVEYLCQYYMNEIMNIISNILEILLHKNRAVISRTTFHEHPSFKASVGDLVRPCAKIKWYCGMGAKWWSPACYPAIRRPGKKITVSQS